MEEGSTSAGEMDKDVSVTNVSEGSADFVRIKQEVDLPEDDTFYPMDFGISVEDEEEMNPVYVKMKSKQPGSSGTKPGIDRSKSYEEDDSEDSEEESEEESDEDSSNSRGERSAEQAGNQGWPDSRGVPGEEMQHPSTSGESIPAPAMTDVHVTPVVIKEEPISDDDEGLSYQKDGEQFAESYKMLESLRRVCTGDGGEDTGHSSQGQTDDLGEDDLFGQRPENFSMMPREKGKQLSRDTFMFRMDAKSRHLMDDKHKRKNSDFSVEPLQNLDLDQTMGTSTSSFTCDLCQKPCGNRTNFIVHLRIKHAEDLPHECGICEVRFATDRILEDHVLINHTGEAEHLFNCHVCGARFNQKYILHAHMLTHNEYAPFACHICRKTFMKNRDLKHHIFNQHDGKAFPCPKCNKVYQLARFLEQHIRNHHDPFICELCSKKPVIQGGLASDDHPTELDRTSPPSDICTEQEEVSAAELQQLSCKICGTAFENLEDSFGHKCQVYRCSICSKDFSSPRLLDPDGKPRSSEKNPLCDTCSKAVSSEDGEKLEESTSTVGGETIQCQVCLKRFPKPIRPLVEGSSHHQQRFACRICGNTYYRKSTLLKHVRVHERERKYMCSICDLIFTKKKGYRRHMKVHLTPYKCFKCNKTFSKQKHLVKHHRSHAKGICNRTFTTKKTLEKHEKCKVCGRSFSRRKNLINHQKSHQVNSSPELYTCIKCFKSFPLKDILIEHLKTHETKTDPPTKYSCDICKLSCVNDLHLANHKKIHAGAKISVCDICGMDFNWRYDLIEHRESAHGQYMCRVCGRAFPTTSELDVHNKEIHGEGNLVCNICDQVCVNQLHLQNHILIHTGSKICVCDYCGHGFANRYDLVKHMEGHTGQKPHCCDICNEGFSETSDLIIHRKMHGGEHPGLIIGDDFTKEEVEDTTS